MFLDSRFGALSWFESVSYVLTFCWGSVGLVRWPAVFGQWDLFVKLELKVMSVVHSAAARVRYCLV